MIALMFDNLKLTIHEIANFACEICQLNTTGFMSTAVQYDVDLRWVNTLQE